MHIEICKYLHIYAYIDLYRFICIYMHAKTYVSIYACLDMICTSSYMYIYQSTYIYI